jgi:hypothetical protein
MDKGMKDGFLTNTVFDEFFSDIIKKMQEEDERKALAKVLENEKTLLLTDCGIIAHPKYKGVLPQALELLEVKVPVMWSGMVEEDKIYLVTDEWLVQRMKEVGNESSKIRRLYKRN